MPAKIACPYCHAVQKFEGRTDCEKCDNEVPRNFIKAAQKEAPVYLATVGFTAHGKSTFLDSLAVQIENLGKISDSTFHEYFDSHTLRSIQETRTVVQRKDKREITQAQGSPPPLLMGVYNFMERVANTLVVYDLGGEIFSLDYDEIERYAEPMQHAHTVWFFVSIQDLRHVTTSPGNEHIRTLSDLFSLYRAGMERLGIRMRGRNLLVIYTKADALATELPPTVRKYLQDDQYTTLSSLRRSEVRKKGIGFDSDDYFEQMQEISQELEDYTYDEIQGGVAFVNMVKDTGMNLKFSITSSIGRGSNANVDRTLDYKRYRVLDPLVWALKLNQGIGEGRSIALIIDHDKQLYGAEVVASFFNALDVEGTVSTYSLGNQESLVEVNTEPPQELPEVDSPHLIGPILEQLSLETHIFVLVGNTNSSPLTVSAGIHDLPDYNTDNWRKRMHLVTPKGVHFDEELWGTENIHVFDVQSDSANTIVESVFKDD
jgi:hypothetical protein